MCLFDTKKIQENDTKSSKESKNLTKYPFLSI